MSKNTWNYVVDFLATLAMLALIMTGFLIQWILPARQGRAGRRMLWGMDRHDWGEIHLYLSIALIGLIVLHVVLHWKWVFATTRDLLRGKTDKPLPSAAVRNFWGVLFFVLIAGLVGGFLYWANEAAVGF